MSKNWKWGRLSKIWARGPNDRGERALGVAFNYKFRIKVRILDAFNEVLSSLIKLKYAFGLPRNWLSYFALLWLFGEEESLFGGRHKFHLVSLDT